MAAISNNDIARAIYLASQDKAAPAFYKDVVRFLDKRRLMARAKDILAHLQKIINEEGGIIEARVSSVEKLTEETKKSLNHFLTKHYRAKEIILKESLNPNLLAGMKIEVNGEVIDLSYGNKIAKLKEYLTR